MALSTQPYKGARDFYPEDKRIQKYMFNQLRQSAERFGYEEYDAPILEPTDLFLAKGNQEIIDEQTYSFEDRGGRKVTIRTEMTPSVSRMVAAKRQELAYPLRWYSIPNLWRYERPQRGRSREFWQLNVDIFGVQSTSAEVEMISVIDDMFKGFGATPDMYDIRINSRELVNYLLNDYLKLTEAEARAIGGLIDRMAKMERSQFIAKVDAALSATAKQAGTTEKLLSILDAKSLKDLPLEAQAQAGAVALDEVLTQLQSAGIKNARFDVTIMRGFDYYTGIVFEVFDTDPNNNRSVLGGGRYDGLVGLFGVAPVPTVGFGLGLSPLENFLTTHRLLPDLKPEAAVYAVLVGDVLSAAQKPIAELRAAGVNVAVDLSGRKVGDQFKIATKKGIEYVLVIGEDELTSNTYALKNLQDGSEQKLAIKDIARVLNT
jgi:histidyl-tRNA synthetase